MCSTTCASASLLHLDTCSNVMRSQNDAWSLWPVRVYMFLCRLERGLACINIAWLQNDDFSHSFQFKTTPFCVQELVFKVRHIKAGMLFRLMSKAVVQSAPQQTRAICDKPWRGWVISAGLVATLMSDQTRVAVIPQAGGGHAIAQSVQLMLTASCGH